MICTFILQLFSLPDTRNHAEGNLLGRLERCRHCVASVGFAERVAEATRWTQYREVVEFLDGRSLVSYFNPLPCIDVYF